MKSRQYTAPLLAKNPELCEPEKFKYVFRPITTPLNGYINAFHSDGFAIDIEQTREMGKTIIRERRAAGTRNRFTADGEQSDYEWLDGGSNAEGFKATSKDANLSGSKKGVAPGQKASPATPSADGASVSATGPTQNFVYNGSQSSSAGESSIFHWNASILNFLIAVHVNEVANAAPKTSAAVASAVLAQGLFSLTSCFLMANRQYFSCS